MSTARLAPEAVAAAVVRLVDALTYQHRVQGLHEADIASDRFGGREWSAVIDLRVAAATEAAAAQCHLTDLVGGVDNEVALALIRQLSDATRGAEARAEQAYKALPAAEPRRPPG